MIAGPALSATGFAAVQGVEQVQLAPVQATAPVQAAVVTRTYFSARSDQELNALLATRWDAMGVEQRVALLSEVKLRMARHKGRDRAIRLQTQRRYGRRVVRQRNGSVVRIQTQVVRVRPAPNGQRSFGVGFEERTKEAQPPAPEAATPPVMTVNHPAP